MKIQDLSLNQTVAFNYEGKILKGKVLAIEKDEEDPSKIFVQVEHKDFDNLTVPVKRLIGLLPPLTNPQPD